MKLIGVTGKSGAGKTTFSDMLAENSNIGVIHIDDILKEFKLKYFKPFLSQDKNGEKTKINSNLKKMLYSNKFIFDLFMRFRAKLIEKTIDKEINRLVQEGNDTIIIDDVFIKYHKIYKEFSKVFIVRRPYTERVQAIRKRDDLTKKEIVATDIAHHKENYKEIQVGNNVEIINNNGTQEELSHTVQKIYEQQFINFKNKYRENIPGKPIENSTRTNIYKNKKTRERNKISKEIGECEYYD